jgi:molecular chaperone GrpE (heat shock protein)
MEKEHKLIQFMVDNTGIDLGAKADEESLQDINIQTLLSLFLKQKSSQPEQKEN